MFSICPNKDKHNRMFMKKIVRNFFKIILTIKNHTCKKVSKIIIIMVMQVTTHTNTKSRLHVTKDKKNYSRLHILLPIF